MMRWVGCVPLLLLFGLLVQDGMHSITLGTGMNLPSEPVPEAMRSLDFWAAQRAYPHRSIPDEGFYRAYEESKMRLAKSDGIHPPDVWGSIGPRNQGGRTNALAVDPQNPNVVYAGSASGGLWRLTMAGDGFWDDHSWEYIDTGFPVLGVNAVAVDPMDSDVIYIGTGEVYGYQNATGGLVVRTTRGSYGIGVLKTTDRGHTWTKSIDWSYHQRRGVLALEMNPLAPMILFAGTTEGTYRTVDGGRTWELVHDVLMAVDVAVDPVDTSFVYVSCGNLGSPGAGMYRSVRGGRAGTWEKLDNGLPAGWTGKTLLSIYRGDPRIVYADVADAFRSIGIYRSKDRGDSWHRVLDFDHAMYQGWFSHYVRVNPTNENDLFIAGVLDYAFRLDEMEAPVFLSLMHPDHHAYADHPTNPDIFYCAHDGGVSRTIDGGRGFMELNDGYVTSQFYNGFSSSPLDPDLAVGGLQDNSSAVYVGSDYWRVGVFFGDGNHTAIHSLNDSILYISRQCLNIHRSTDRGRSFEALRVSNRPLACSGDVGFIAPYVLSPSHPSILYAGSNRIHKSEDGGDRWATMNGGVMLDANPILSLAVHRSDPDIVYAATAPHRGRRGRVFASSDGAESWREITGNLPDRFYVDLQVSPDDADVVYITLSGFGSSHVFRTDDGGVSWVDIGEGLPDVPTSAVAVDPDYPAFVYAGNDLGVYFSADRGNTWLDFRENLPTAVLVMDLSVSPMDRKLRVVTHGNGVYERSLIDPSHIEGYETEDPDMPDDAGQEVATFALLGNYPNPFNTETKISFELSNSAVVSLAVYNHRGQRIRILATQEYPQGLHTVAWYGTDDEDHDLPSGIYFCRMMAGDDKASTKMTLVR